jgi:hypothetical protein
LPVAHSVHIAAPVVSENLPASQSEHVVAHVHEYLPGLQVLHVSDEGAAEYLPAQQGEHAPSVMAPTVEYEPGSQFMHSLPVEYLPASQ